MITFGSLFAGIGGFDLGFERAGMVCKWQVEIDGYCQRVLTKHWPHVRRWNDVRTWPQHDTEPVDVICGGFPCQDISYAGLGAGLDGERSGLFFEAVRVVRQLRPRIVVLENVAALLTRGLDRVLGTLAEIGYDAEWHCIPAAAVGAPHIRDRVFVIGKLAGMVGNAECTPENVHNAGGGPRDTTGESGCSVSDTESERCRTRGTRGTSDTGEREENSANVADADQFNQSGRQMWSGRRKRVTQADSPNAWEGGIERSDWWATEPAVGRVANGVSARVDRLRGLGNAVVPQVAEWIGRRIVEAITD